MRPGYLTGNHETVLLRFIGSEDHIISDFGCIWNRNKIQPNSEGLVTRWYLPMVIRDRIYPYPWVLLPTQVGSIWIPVNQLLGWAFQPRIEQEPAYFISDKPGILPLDIDSFHWTTKAPIEDPHSRYLQFVRSIYPKHQNI